VQNPVIRRVWPRRYRRSDTYRKLIALDRKHGFSAALNARRGLPSREYVAQDVDIPVGRGAEFLRWFVPHVGMSPVWLCPMRLRGTPLSKQPWPLYPLRPGDVYVNFGFWGTRPLPPGAGDGHYNRLIEEEVTSLGGRKGLYSSSFYSEEEFWALFNGPEYFRLKSEYDGNRRLASLYDKCVTFNNG